MVEPGQQLSLELQNAEEISRICEISEADIRIVNTAPYHAGGTIITSRPFKTQGLRNIRPDVFPLRPP